MARRSPNNLSQRSYLSSTKVIWSVEPLYNRHTTLGVADRSILEDFNEWFPDLIAISVQYAKAAAEVATIFKDLGNTGTAVHRRWAAEMLIPSNHRTREPAIDRTILKEDATRALTQFRHPDPAMVHRSQVVDPSLQLLGSWKKLKVKKSAGPGRRMGFSGFIWDGTSSPRLAFSISNPEYP